MSKESSEPTGVGGARLKKLGSFCEVVIGSPIGIGVVPLSMMGDGGESTEGRKEGGS